LSLAVTDGADVAVMRLPKVPQSTLPAVIKPLISKVNPAS